MIIGEKFNEKLLLQQLTTGIRAYKILMDKNDNLYVSEATSDNYNILPAGGNIYFPNGSVVAAANTEYFCVAYC